MSLNQVIRKMIIFKIYLGLTGIQLINSQCTNGWTLGGNYCYKLIPISDLPTGNQVSPAGWTATYSQCAYNYGNLPTFDSVQDWNDFVAWTTTNLAAPAPAAAKSIALGYIRYDTNNTNPTTSFVDFMKSSPALYTNWDTNHPVFSATQNCVQAISSTRKWQTIACGTTGSYYPICQQGIPSSSVATVQCSAVCRNFVISSPNGHRFSTDQAWCVGTAGINITNEGNNIGYASSIHIPGTTEIVATLRSSTRPFIVAMGKTDINTLLTNGKAYSIDRHFYVPTYPTTSSTPYSAIWSSNSNQPGDSLLTATDAGEEAYLLPKSWVRKQIGYLSSAVIGNGQCSLSANCKWNAWSNWGSCNATCGLASQVRQRTKSFDERNGGSCDNIYNQTQQCSLSPCPINCIWSAWSALSTCSKSCGPGTQSQSRTKIVTEANGGTCDSLASSQQTSPSNCNIVPCPIDCTWGGWTYWSACSKTCGGGNTTRTRAKSISEQYNGICDNTFSELNSCNTFACPIDCVWSAWSALSTCSKSCGPGTQSRSRTKIVTEANGGTCNTLAPSEQSSPSNCNTVPCPIDCTWGGWAGWSACSKTCGGGNTTRTRAKSISEQYNGICDNTFSELNTCNTFACPIDCVWNNWLDWSMCSKTCANGTQTKTRTKNIYEQFGGVCNGSPNATQYCNIFPCPINCTWNTWSEFTNCSETCGGGNKTRERTKKITEKYNGICNKLYNETLSCNTFPCPIDCVLSQWTPYSQCSLTCGSNGTQTRDRSILISPAYNGTPCLSTFNKKACKTPACKKDPMSPQWRTASTVMQAFGCGVIIGLLSFTIIIFLIVRVFTFERMLHMCQELSLLVAHVLVTSLAFRSETNKLNPNLCAPVSVILQYCFITYYTFLVLECLHTYCILTNVIEVGGLFSMWKYFAFGFGFPALLTTITGIAFFNDYKSDMSCWTNWGVDAVAGSSFVPIICLAITAIVIFEATGMQEARPFADFNQFKRRAAQSSRHSMLILIPLHTASWIIGSTAVYSQQAYMYPAVLALNAVVGVAICVFHVISNATVHKILSDSLTKCRLMKKERKLAE